MPWQCRKCIEALADGCQEWACTFSTIEGLVRWSSSQ